MTPSAAVHLHRRVDHLLRVFGGVELGHRRGAAVVGCRRRPAARRRGRSSSAEASMASRHVGELRLGDRIVGERAARRACGSRAKRERLVERAAGEAERGGADRDAEQVQRLHADAEALARLAEQCVGGQAHIVEFQPGERVRRDHLDPLGDASGRGRRARTMKARDALARPRLRRCGRRSRRNRRCRRWRCRSSRRRAPSRRRRASRACRDVGGVGAGFGLGQREGGDRLAAARPCGSHVALLLVGAEQADRARAQPLHGEGEIGEAGVAGQRLAGDGEAAHVGRAVAVARRTA